MYLTIVRHGETIENVRCIQQGQIPGTLTPKGVEQAKKLGRRLKEDHFDFIYCSDLKRTKDTCNEIIKYHPLASIIYTPELREFSKGFLEGKKKIPTIKDRYKIDFNYRPGGGENINELYERVSRFMFKLKKTHPTESVLLVTHGSPLRILLSQIMDFKLDHCLNVDFKHTSITKFKLYLQPPHQLVLFNDTSHLG